MLDGYYKRIQNAEHEQDLTYDYEGDWDEQMLEVQGAIAKKVEELKNR